jgi:arabinose-5-phosphate isomerase
VFDVELKGLQEVRTSLDKNFSRAVELVLGTVRQQKKVIVTGVGKSGAVGQKIAATLTSTGAAAVTLDPMNAVHGDLGMISKGDLILMLSYSGETDELLRILPGLKRDGNKIIAMTGNPQSNLARQADLHLGVTVSKEACPHNLAPTTSTTAMLVLGDALAMVVLDARGFRKEDFARLHPGGAIGRNLLVTVRDVMRSLDLVSICPATTTVQAALAEMTRKRCGAAIVVNTKGRLSGIYTHGDFVRSYQTNKNIGAVPIGKVMTANPVRVGADSLAVEVLNIFEKNRIEDLIVVDKHDRPVGLVDVQDLTKFRIM